MATPTKRKPMRKQGPRTTLRVPAGLARLADEIARAEGATRNEALLELAVLGAKQRSRLLATEALARRRVAGIDARRRKRVTRGTGYPTEEELAALIEKRTEYYIAG